MSTSSIRNRISQEQEQSVIVSLIDNPNNYVRLPSGFSSEFFEAVAHRTLMDVINHFQLLSIPYDFLVIETYLIDNSLIERAGGEDYLLHLSKLTPQGFAIKTHAENIMGLYKKRKALEITKELEHRFLSGESVSSALEETSRALMELCLNEKASSVKKFDMVVDTYRDNLFALAEMSESERLLKTQGISTGIVALDNKLVGGLKDGHMIVIAGRPSMGKSLLALNMARAIACQSEDAPVIFFSIEMTTEGDVAPRVLSDVMMIPMLNLQTARLSGGDVAMWNHYLPKAKGLNLYIDDTTNNMEGIKLESRKLALKHKGKIAAIFVDYIQLMQLPKGVDRYKGITQNSIDLKSLAKELSCPVVVLSQLSRECEKRPKNKRPLMSDLKESGQIEQDADVAMLLYRDDVYARLEGRKSAGPGICEIDVAKQRGGTTGVVLTHFNGPYQRFEDVDPHHYGEGHV